MPFKPLTNNFQLAFDSIEVEASGISRKRAALPWGAGPVECHLFGRPEEPVLVGTAHPTIRENERINWLHSNGRFHKASSTKGQ